MISLASKNQLQLLKKGDPPAKDQGLFGASLAVNEAQIVLIPAPFEVTTSYGQGTAKTPAEIIEASHQLDLFDLAFGNCFLAGVAFCDGGDDVRKLNDDYLELGQSVIRSIESGQLVNQQDLDQVNTASHRLNQIVEARALDLLDQSKLVGLVGGDHSTPYGLIKALAAKYSQFDIIHIDAHHDLRLAYEGFEHSHASIMHNVLTHIPEVSQLLSIAIRDFSQTEQQFASGHPKVTTVYDRQLSTAIDGGDSFAALIARHLDKLGTNVYVSFDIDGLDPSLCPSTGTPVPGGLSYNQAMTLLETIHSKGKKLIGFDLTEVSPGDNHWDLNVGARMLYKLCGLGYASQDLADLI